MHNLVFLFTKAVRRKPPECPKKKKVLQCAPVDTGSQQRDVLCVADLPI